MHPTRRRLEPPLAVHGRQRPPGGRERGASLVEYCLLVGLIALVAIGGVSAFGTARDEMFHDSASTISGS